MRKLLIQTLPLFAVILFISSDVQAQKFSEPDKSPADIVYYRSGGEVIARVVYSRPQANGREIFGGLVKYGKVWRTGANEATEIEFFQEVTIGNQKVKPGTYTIFSIPAEEEWTVILSSQRHQWGAYRYKDEMDVLRVKVTPEPTKERLEFFSITFENNQLIMGWDDTMVAVPIEI